MPEHSTSTYYARYCTKKFMHTNNLSANKQQSRDVNAGGLTPEPEPFLIHHIQLTPSAK